MKKNKLLEIVLEFIILAISIACFAICYFVHLGEPTFTVIVLVAFLLLVWDSNITKWLKKEFLSPRNVWLFQVNGFLVTMRKERYAHSGKPYYKAYYTEFSGGKPRGYSSDWKKKKDCIKQATENCKAMLPSTIKWDDL